MFKDPQHEWCWILLAENGRKIAESGESYHNEKDCLDAITLVMATSHQTPVNFL
jgi:uncharacterized protein YegP (UPF0339 family)